ncbi:hypothetical protein BDW69DRAFT_190748 [Aspergillus filifer]
MAQRLHVLIGALLSAYLLLHNLQADMPNWVEHHEFSFTNLIHTKYDWNNFCTLCEDALSQAAEDNIIMAAPLQNKKDKNSGGNQIIKQEDWKVTCKGLEKGQLAEDYVNSFLNAKKTKDKNGYCLYCRKFRHGVDKCFYLVPSRQREGWKPLETIWAYHIDKKGKTTSSSSGDAGAHAAAELDDLYKTNGG